jgi:hypothetical protein
VPVHRGRARHATAELIAHLAELETRTVLEAEAHSLFSFCRDVLHLSEHSAYNRIAAARAARKFPVILERPEAPPTPPPPNSPRGELPPSDVRTIPAAFPPPPPRATVVPLAPTRFALHVTLGQEAHHDLRRLQDLLCREVPSGDPARIVELALALLRREVEKKKCAATDRPRASKGTAPGSRDIDAAVERAVRERDEDRCAFIGKCAHDQATQDGRETPGWTTQRLMNTCLDITANPRTCT